MRASCPHDAIDGYNPNGCVWCDTDQDAETDQEDLAGGEVSR